MHGQERICDRFVLCFLYGFDRTVAIAAHRWSRHKSDGVSRKVGFLTGSASQSHAYYSANWNGYLQLLKDGWDNIDRYYPKATAVVAVIGFLFDFPAVEQ